MTDALRINLDLGKWPLRDQFAYREKAGVNPQYAYAETVDAMLSGGANAVLNIPPEYLLGFVWVTQLHEQDAKTWDELLDELDYDALLEAFADALKPIVDELAKQMEEDKKRPTKAGGSGDPARTTTSSRPRKQS